jgi:hypothetical protein
MTDQFEKRPAAARTRAAARKQRAETLKRSIVDWFAIEAKQPPESDALSVLGSSKKAD